MFVEDEFLDVENLYGKNKEIALGLPNPSKLSDVEQFIYMNEQQNVLFFTHVCFSKTFNKLLSHQIYNCLISNRMIMDPDKIVIIYEVNQDGTIDVITIQHCCANNKYSFKKDELIKQFVRILQISYDELIVVIYNQKINRFSIKYVTFNSNSTNPELTEDDVQIQNIVNIITIKPFLK